MASIQKTDQCQHYCHEAKELNTKVSYYVSHFYILIKLSSPGQVQRRATTQNIWLQQCGRVCLGSATHNQSWETWPTGRLASVASNSRLTHRWEPLIEVLSSLASKTLATSCPVFKRIQFNVSFLLAVSCHLAYYFFTFSAF